VISENPGGETPRGNGPRGGVKAETGRRSDAGSKALKQGEPEGRSKQKAPEQEVSKDSGLTEGTGELGLERR
jgi:hypothetical protein